MARDPNEPRGAGQFLEEPDDFKAQGIEIPSGYVVGTKNGQYYAMRQTYADGHTTVHWYKRGAGGGAGKPDPEEARTAGPPAAAVKDAWDKGEATTATAAAKNPTSVYQGVFPAGHPRAGVPAMVTEYETGAPDYKEIVAPAAATAAAAPPTTKDEGGRRYQWEPNPGGPTAGGKWVDVGPAPPTPAEAAADAKTAADAKAGQPTPTLREVKQPDGSTKMVRVLVYPPSAQYPQGKEEVLPSDVPGAPAPKPAPPTNVSAPSNQRVIEERIDNGDGTFTITPRKNPNWKPETKLVQDPETKVWTQITETEDGGYTIKPVDGQTIIKPADLPVLQTKFGEIASNLGALAQQLNTQLATGKITPEQRKEAWTAAYQQAQTATSEINSILSNSQSIWAGEINQRGQTLQDTQGRRSFAQNIFDRAAATGMGIATSAGPGHGKAIAGGVAALMNMGQRYAEGMGGFRESPEVSLPPALQQARGISLPGFGGPAAPVASGLPVASGESRVTSGAAPPLATPNSPLTTPPEAVREYTPAIGGPPQPLPERNGVPVTSTPASPARAGDPGFFRPDMQQPSTADPGFYPPGMQGPSTTDPGFYPPGMSPQAMLMGGQMQAGLSPQGMEMGPVTGIFDVEAETQGMLAGRDDPDWQEAVRAAAAGLGPVQQPGYAWDRFSQPRSRFG